MASLRILLVEDHADTADVTGRLLRLAGHAVQHAATCAEARALVAAGHRFDLVVCDVGLPDGDGCDLFAELRAGAPALRGLTFTGHGMEAEVDRFARAGFHGHLLKPVNFPTMVAAVGQAMAGEA